MLTVQVTTFSCGGIVLCVSFHHMCTDGRGFFQFMNVWGCLARNQPFPEPCHNRSLYTSKISVPPEEEKQEAKCGFIRRVLGLFRTTRYFIDLLFQCLKEPNMSSVCISLNPEKLRRLKQLASDFGKDKVDPSDCGKLEYGEEKLENILALKSNFSRVKFISTDDAVCAAFWKVLEIS